MTTMKEISNEYNILIVGDCGTGKSSYIKRYKSGLFESKYNPTNGLNIERLRCFTNKGDIQLKVWDISGHDQYQELLDGYFVGGGQSAIIFFDVSSSLSYRNVPNWYRCIDRMVGKIPMVLCGNKIDLENERQVKPKDILFNRKKSIPYCEISVKTWQNCDAPFLYILQLLVNDKNLKIVQQPALSPPEPKNFDSFDTIEEELRIANDIDFMIKDDNNEIF